MAVPGSFSPAEDLSIVNHLYERRWISEDIYNKLVARIRGVCMQPDGQLLETVTIAKVQASAYTRNASTSAWIRAPQRCSLCHQLRRKHVCSKIPCPSAEACGQPRLHKKSSKQRRGGQMKEKNTGGTSQRRGRRKSASSGATSTSAATKRGGGRAKGTKRSRSRKENITPPPAASPVEMPLGNAMGLGYAQQGPGMSGAAAAEVATPSASAAATENTSPATIAAIATTLGTTMGTQASTAPVPMDLGGERTQEALQAELDAALSTFCNLVRVPCSAVHGEVPTFIVGAEIAYNSLFFKLQDGSMADVFYVEPTGTSDVARYNRTLRDDYRNWVMYIREKYHGASS